MKYVRGSVNGMRSERSRKNMKQLKTCNEDCFHCPYPDCMRLSSTLSSLDYPDPAGDKRKAKQREYYAKNRERILAYQHEYRLKNLARIRAKDRAYYQARKKRMKEQNEYEDDD